MTTSSTPAEMTSLSPMKYLNHHQQKGKKRKANILSTNPTLLQNAKTQRNPNVFSNG
jgi:hypothetical protein